MSKTAAGRGRRARSMGEGSSGRSPAEVALMSRARAGSPAGGACGSNPCTGVAPASGRTTASRSSSRARVRLAIQSEAQPRCRHSTAAPRAAPPAPSRITGIPASGAPSSSCRPWRDRSRRCCARPARGSGRSRVLTAPIGRRPARPPAPASKAMTLWGTVRFRPRKSARWKRSRARGRSAGSTSNLKYRHAANRASPRASSASAALCIAGLSECPTGCPSTARAVPAKDQRSRSPRVRAGSEALKGG